MHSESQRFLLEVSAHSCESVVIQVKSREELAIHTANPSLDLIKQRAQCREREQEREQERAKERDKQHGDVDRCFSLI